MKRFIVLLAIVMMLFTIGCSKEWMAHDTVFKSNSHMAFSWGFGDCDDDTREQSKDWWGDDTTCDEHADMAYDGAKTEGGPDIITN